MFHGVPTRAAAGYAPTTAGPGFRTNPSAGRPITMAAGPCCAASAGSGCRVRSGRPHGSPGAAAAVTSAGRRCRRKPSSGVAAAGVPTSMSPSASARSGSILSRSATSAAPSTAIACPISATLISIGKPPTSPTSTSTTGASSAVVRSMPISAADSANPCPSTASTPITGAGPVAMPRPCARASKATDSEWPRPRLMPNGMPPSSPAGSGTACNRSPWNVNSLCNPKLPTVSARAAGKTASGLRNPSPISVAANPSSNAGSNVSKPTAAKPGPGSATHHRR